VRSERYLVLCDENGNMVCDKGHVERMDSLHCENSQQKETLFQKNYNTNTDNYVHDK
jgi:hypothetical protein